MDSLDADFSEVPEDAVEITVSLEEQIDDDVQGEELEKEEEEEVVNDRTGEMFAVTSEEEMKEVIEEYCNRTASRFVVRKRSKNFGRSSLECDLTHHQVQWHDLYNRHNQPTTINNVIQFDGIPHITVGHYQMNCEFGIDSKATRKKKEQRMKEGGRPRKNPSKKCGCPATINVKQVLKFPEIRILKDTERRKRSGASKLKKKLETCRSELQTELLIFGRLPEVSEHKYHELMEGREFSKEVIHPEVRLKAKELYLENKSNNEVLEGIRDYVVNDMFYNQDLPPPDRRRFFPKMKDIHNIVRFVQNLCKFTEEKEEIVTNTINEIKQKGDNVIFRTDERKVVRGGVRGDSSGDKSNESDEDTNENIKNEKRKEKTFVYVHQTLLQQRLMIKYGHEVSYLVEIKNIEPVKHVFTYLMYALAVQTNVDFQVIGFMCCSKRKKEGLLECLEIFRSWNSSWIPRYFIVDCSQAIYDAVAGNFPNANYFLTPHSCGEQWLNFVQKLSNDVMDHAEEIITYMRNMQFSLTEESLTLAAALLEESLVWQNSGKLREWFQAKWLHNAKRWVFGYRPEDLLVTQHMKASLSDCIYPYRAAAIQSDKIDGFIEMIRNIAFDLSETSYNRYVQNNREHHSFCLRYKKTNDISHHLRGVPVMVIPYVDKICQLAEKNEFLISYEQCGVFTVQVPFKAESLCSEINVPEVVNDMPVKSLIQCASQCLDKLSFYDTGVEIIKTEFGYIECSDIVKAGSYTVSFGDIHSYSFCTCPHWLLYRLPCVHMFAVFCQVPDWNFNMLSPSYRFNSLFDIDFSCINADDSKTSTCEQGCQVVDPRCHCLEEPIFEHPDEVSVLLAVQAKGFLKHVEKMRFLFKNKNLHRALSSELGVLVDSSYNYIDDNNPSSVAEDCDNIKQKKSPFASEKCVKLIKNEKNKTLRKLGSVRKRPASCQSEAKLFIKKTFIRDASNMKVSTFLQPMRRNNYKLNLGNKNIGAIIAAGSKSENYTKIQPITSSSGRIVSEEQKIGSDCIDTDILATTSEKRQPVDLIRQKVPLKCISSHSGICEKPVISKMIPAVKSDQDSDLELPTPSSDKKTPEKSDIDLLIDRDSLTSRRFVNDGDDPKICELTQ